MLQNILTSSISIFLRNSFIFIGGIVILITLDFSLTMIVFALVPIVILPILIIGKKLKKLSKISQDKTANMAALMEENLSFVKLIQAYVKENFITEKFNDSLDQVVSAARSRIITRSILTVTVIVIVFLGVAVILYQGGNLVFEEKLSAGEFSAFLFYTIIVAASFGNE